MRILIVEDDKVISLLLTKMIERMEYIVVDTATKGAEAIQKIEDNAPDLILMDIMLEDDIDGIEAMLKLRQNGLSTPVIYITSNSDPYNMTRAEETNYNDYLIKPVNFDELKSAIKKVLL